MTPGKHTTEFWLNVAFVVAFVANGTAYVNIPWDQMIVLAGVCGVYTGARAHVKASVAKTE